MSKIFASLILCALCLGNPSAFAQIYKVVKPDGSIAYTDRPPQEGEQAEVPNLPDIIFQPAVTIPTEPTAASAPVATQKLQVRISSPQQNTVLHGAASTLEVTASIQPALPEGVKLVLLHRGQAYSAPQTNARWTMLNLNPGSHSLQVEAIDAEGEFVASSPPVQFHVIPR